MAHLQYMPGDPRLVDQLVYELKSKGIFDQFRKECIADVDTRPAYQNLRQRVESSVATFLARQCWKPDLNKNQLREKLRKHILDGNYLEQGVERIVDQVVNPKVASVFIPQVEDLVYNYLGITRKKTPVESPEKTVDLLPTDLEAVSPGSVKSNNDKEDVSMDIDSNTAEKMDLDTDKAKEEVEIIEDKKDCQNTEILSSNEFDVNVDRSCIPLPSEEIKLENIPEPENSPPKASEVELEKIALPKEQVPSTDIPLPEEIIQTESNFKPMLLQSEDSNSSSGSSLRRNMSPLTPIRNYNNENSCDAQQAFETDAKINDKEPSSFRFTIEAENSQDQTDNKKKEPEQSDLAYQFNNQVNINSFNTPLYDESSNSNNLRIDYESDANSKAMVDTKPESENTEERKEKKDDKKSQKSSHRSRDSHRHSSTKDKRSDSKHSNSRDGSKHERKSSNKDDHKKSNKDSRDRSKDRSDKKENRESTKHRSSKSSSHKESKSHRSSSSSQRHSSKTSDDKKISSSSHKEKEKESKDKSSKDRSKDSRSSSHKSEKDRKSSSSSKKSDEKDKKKDKKDIDDHYSSSGRGNHGRRSTDRDSNDGSSSSKGSNNQNGSKSSDKKSSSKSSSSKSDNTSTTSGDTSSPSDKDQKLQINQLSQFKPAVRVDNHLETPIATPPRLPFVPDITLKKPKFAANLAEARQMMKMRKFLDEEQKRMNQEAALLLEFQANVRPSLSQVYSSIPGPELEFACGDNTIVNPSQSTIESVNENLDNSDESTDHKDEIQPEPQSVQQIFDIILGNPSEIEISDQKNIETYDENKPFSKLVEEISEYSKASENKVKLDKTNEQPEESKQEDNDTNAAEYFEVTADNVSESGNEEKMDIDEVKIEINEKEIDEEIESPPFEDITENPDVTESKIEIPDYTKNKLAINLIEVKDNKKEFVEEKESLKTREIAENVEIPEVDKNTKSIVKDIKEISEDTIEESIENIKECLEKDNVVVKTKDEDIIPDQSQEHLDQEETKKISSNENVILESVTNNTKNEKKIPEIIPINANKSEKIPEILPIKTSKEKKVSKNISKEKKVPDNVPINIVKEKIIPETVQENTNKNIKSLEIVPLNANKEKIITEIIPINVNNEKKVPEIVPDNTINEKKVQEIISLNITKEKIPQIVPLNANKDKENPETAPLKDNPEILQLSSNKDSRSIKPVIELEIDIEDELKVHTILKYFTNEEKITAQSDSEKFTKFFKSYTEFTSKLHLINCDTYEENIIKEVAKNFGDYEIVNYFKNGHTKVPKKSKNIVKDIRLSQEVTLPTKTIFSPTKSECSFELSSDYDAKLDEIVNKKSRQEVMEIILGGVIEDNPKTTNETTKTSNKSTNNSKESTNNSKESTNNSKESTNNSNESTKTSNEGRTLNDNESGDEKNLKRKGKVESSVNDKRSILTPTKLRKLSDSDQISSTTEEAEEMSSNNNKVQITTRSKYLGRAKRVGLSRPKRCNLVNSPSSDKSVENYVQNTPPAAVNGKIKPTPRSKVQRYDTSDLYKPKLHYLSRRNNIT